MIHTLRLMKHKVRTAHGDSFNTYGGDEFDDPHGASQGNAAGPAIWALVSSPLLEILRENGYGAKFVSPIKKEFFHLCGFAFVDDTDTIQTAEAGTSTEELVERTQEQLDLWECLIRSTGGAIVGEKSDYTVINWIWRDGIAKYQQCTDGIKMDVLNEHGEREELEHLPTNKARRTLGVWQAADGNEKTQTEKLKNKANEWSTLVARSHLKKGDVQMGVITSLYPSLTYGLMATALSEKQAKEVFGPIRAKVFPKLKICRTAPEALVHGPSEYGGMEIKNLHTLQGIAHIKALLEEASQPSATGKLMRNLYEYHQLECGLEEDLFHQPYDLLAECMTDTWMKNTTAFAFQKDIEVKPVSSTLKKWCERDSFLMKDAINAGYRGKALAAINRCRMHLQAVTLSDIAVDQGSRITLESFDVRCSDNSSMRSSYYKWPPQPRPPLKDRRIWKQFLPRAYDTESGHLDLPFQCDGWSRDAALQSKWTYCPETEALYERTSCSEWRRWIATKRRRSPEGNFRPTDSNSNELPSHVDIAIVQINHMPESVRLVSVEGAENGTIPEPAGLNNRIGTLRNQLDTVHPSLQWLVKDVDLPEDNGSAIAQAILTGDGKCMSDGSLKDQLGTSAYTFVIDDKANNYIGRNVVPGEDDEQNSYRSEMCGILGNMLIVQAICDLHGIAEPCEIKVGCDNRSALWNGLGPTPVHMKMASTDLVKAIRHIRQTSTIMSTYDTNQTQLQKTAHEHGSSVHDST